MRFAIRLQDQAIADHEVHDAHSGNRHLPRERETVPVEPQTKEGFEPAVGIGPGEVDEPAVVAVQRSPESGLLRRIEEPLPQGGLERSEERLHTTASHDLHEGMDDADATAVCRVDGSVTVEDAAAAGLLVRMLRNAHGPVIGVDPRVTGSLAPRSSVQRPYSREAVTHATRPQWLRDSRMAGEVSGTQ